MNETFNPPLRGHRVNTVLIDDALLIPPNPVIPIFVSHYSLGSSILTLDEAGKTEPGNPVSIVDLARTHHLKQVILVEDRIDGFIEAHKNLSKPFKPTPPKSLADYLKDEQKEKKTASDADRAAAQATLDQATAKYEREKTWSTEPIQLIYGLRLTVVPDMTDKTQESARQESRIIVFLKNSQAYSDVIRLWNRAWTDGYFTPARESGHGRIDWKTLKELWTPNLSLALPYFSSFLARNTLTFAAIVPELPVPANEVTLFKETKSGLPFAPLLDGAVERFATDSNAQIQPVKTIYYATKADFDTFVTYKAIHNRATFGAPDEAHLCSDAFCFEEWLRLTKGASC